MNFLFEKNILIIGTELSNNSVNQARHSSRQKNAFNQ